MSFQFFSFVIKHLAMLNKIYLVIFAVALLIMSFLTFFCYSQLQSIGFAPAQIVQNFEYYNGTYKLVHLISSLVLLVLSNIILWSYRRSWSLWVTFGFFAIFLLVDYWWLGDMLFNYQKANNLWQGSFYIGGLFAAIFCVIIGIGIFFNQFLVLRMRDKMFDKSETTVSIDTEAEKLIEANSSLEDGK